MALEIYLTADGSPTALLAGLRETMHSARGAHGETVYVYGAALAAAPPPWRCLSIGLGLGYVEMLIADAAGDESWTCRSFERETELRAAMLGWLRGEASVHDAVADRYRDGVRGRLARALGDGRWRIDGALDAATEFPERAGVILFDAFSRATSPELWDERFLDAFLARAAAPRCVFATYASTKGLKRALRRAGFRLETRRGFGGKRESTLAVR